MPFQNLQLIWYWTPAASETILQFSASQNEKNLSKKYLPSLPTTRTVGPSASTSRKQKVCFKLKVGSYPPAGNLYQIEIGLKRKCFLILCVLTIFRFREICCRNHPKIPEIEQQCWRNGCGKVRASILLPSCACWAKNCAPFLPTGADPVILVS